MSRSLSALRAHHGLAVPAVLLTLLVAAPVAAQGTMTPTQPPSAATGTPNQPPPTPTQPPPVAPAQPTASNPSPASAAAQTSTVEDEEKSDAPKARTGFQLSLRTGVAIPLGEVQKDSDLSDGVGPQIPLILDIGGKIIPQLFIGAYLGLNFGGVGGKVKEACDKVDASCGSFGGRIGAQIQYHIIPGGKVNPWVGYGIGYEILGITFEKGSQKQTTALAGVEFAHLMAGVDFRLTKVFGIGPFVDFAIGQYTKAVVEVNGKEQGAGDIKDTAMHQWLTLGAKFTFFP